MKKQILFLVMIIAVMGVVSGCKWKNKKIDNQTKRDTVAEDGGNKATTTEAIGTQNMKSTQSSEVVRGELSVEEKMQEIIEKRGGSSEMYKIYEKIKNPFDSNREVVLFGLDEKKTKECCNHPTAIFINETGEPVESSYVAEGSLGNLFIENVKWVDGRKVEYDFIVSGDGGESKTKEYLSLDK